MCLNVFEAVHMGTMPLDCAKELGYSQDWHCAEQYFFPFLCVILSLLPYVICPITFPLFKQCIKYTDLLEVWSHEDQWLLDQHVLVGHSIPIPLELTPALIICCDAVTTCDYTIYSFVIPEYKLTYYIFWMALQCSLHCIPLKIYAVISNKNMTFNNTQCSCFQITRHVSTRTPQFQLIWNYDICKKL